MIQNYGKNDEEVEELLSTAKIFNDDTGIEIQPRQMCKSQFYQEKVTSMNEIKLDETTSIKELK